MEPPDRDAESDQNSVPIGQNAVFAWQFNLFLISILRDLKSALIDDLDGIYVLLCVAVGSSARYMRHAEKADIEIDVLTQIVANDLGGVGLAALVRMSGLPRRTAQRKLAHLVDLGYVERIGGGYVLAIGLLEKFPHIITLIESQWRSYRHLNRKLRDLGLEIV